MRLQIPVLALTLAGCSDYGYTEAKQTDTFQQSRRNAVDLLIVIDNSCSMVEEQENLAANFSALVDTFETADVDWRIGVTTTDTESDVYRGLLIGGDDEIILRTENGDIDRVEYDREFVFAAGVALQVPVEKYRWNSNDTSLNWCAAPGDFGTQKGSPGEWNPNCDGSAPTLPEAAPDEGPHIPGTGELVITEIMAHSNGLDSKCEWFEITNTTPDTLILDGLQILDRGRNAVALPADAFVDPYGVKVVGRSADTSENCDTPVDYAFADGLSLNEDVRWIDRETPDGDELFSEMVAQGTLGTGIEMGLEGARLVFEEPYYSEQNFGFIRGDHRPDYDTPDDDGDEANFSVLFVSDEEDYSPYPSDAYVRYFTDIKGDAAYRDRDQVNLSAVIGKDPPPAEGQPSCESDAGIAAYGTRYLKAVNETRGLAESICADDFAPIISELGLTLSGLEVDFELSEFPQLDTLKVSLYATEESDSLVGELVIDQDFTYVADGNYLHFSEAQLPPSEYYVVAKYEIAANAGQGQ